MLLHRVMSLKYAEGTEYKMLKEWQIANPDQTGIV